MSKKGSSQIKRKDSKASVCSMLYIDDEIDPSPKHTYLSEHLDKLNQMTKVKPGKIDTDLNQVMKDTSRTCLTPRMANSMFLQPKSREDGRRRSVMSPQDDRVEKDSSFTNSMNVNSELPNSQDGVSDMSINSIKNQDKN